jgi:hypothetical protein
MWDLETFVAPVVTGATGTVHKRLQNIWKKC